MTQNRGADFSFLLVAGFILIAGIVCSTLWLQSIQPDNQVASRVDSAIAATSGGFWARFHRGRRVKLDVVPPPEEGGAETEASAAAAPADDGPAVPVGDVEAVIAAVNAGGCAACHTIPNIPGAVGQVGPDLSNIGVDAATRIDGYSAEEYIHESLVAPNVFTAPECPTGPCPPGAMPNLLLSDAEIDTIVAYLVSLGVN